MPSVGLSRRFLSAAVVAGLTFWPASPGARAQEFPEAPPSCADADVAFTLETVASGLEVPWDFAFTPDGHILVTERRGRIRVIRDGRLLDDPWARLSVVSPDSPVEAGLLGITLAPDFEETGHVYVVGTFEQPESLRRKLSRWWHSLKAVVRRQPGPERQIRYESRVYRFTHRGEKGVDPKKVIDGLGSHLFHAGGSVAFGPDGMLYLTTGDGMMRGRAEDPESSYAKLLRFRPDGSIPGDNPNPASPILAMGIRNSEGLAWHPETGELFGTELGPDRDKLNVIVPGSDYGWPHVAGWDDSGRYREPLAVWYPSIAPAGIAFYTGDDFPWHGDAFVGGLRGQQLRRIALVRDRTAPPGWRVACEQALLEGEAGRIRAVRMGPDGHLYLTTSNRDGRGTPRSDDDRLLRLVPVDGSSARHRESGS